MSNPSSLPQYLKSLKAERDQVVGEIQTLLTTVGDGKTTRLVSSAATLMALGTRRDILNYAIETLHRGTVTGNQDPAYRLQMLEDLLLDRIYSEIDTGNNLIGHAAIAMRQRVLRDIIRDTKSLRIGYEKSR